MYIIFIVIVFILFIFLYCLILISGSCGCTLLEDAVEFEDEKPETVFTHNGSKHHAYRVYKNQQGCKNAFTTYDNKRYVDTKCAAMKECDREEKCFGVDFPKNAPGNYDIIFGLIFDYCTANYERIWLFEVSRYNKSRICVIRILRGYNFTPSPEMFPVLI